MTRRRGWGGLPPATDEEASQRIVTAAVELLKTTGKPISIADVAASLGVIRQTVYRYFPTGADLMRAAALASVDEFIDGLAECVHGIHDPADAMTEAVLYTLDEVRRTPHLGILVSVPGGEHTGEVASTLSQHFGMKMINRFDVDWRAYGFDDADLADLVEFTLRTMMSFWNAPDTRGRTPEQMRAFIRRWLGGAISIQSSLRVPE